MDIAALAKLPIDSLVAREVDSIGVGGVGSAGLVVSDAAAF